MNIIEIDKEYITLGQMLKMANVISSGGMAKWFLSEYIVYVNEEEEQRRGKKLYDGDIIEIPESGIFEIRSTHAGTEHAH